MGLVNIEKFDIITIRWSVLIVKCFPIKCFYATQLLFRDLCSVLETNTTVDPSLEDGCDSNL